MKILRLAVIASLIIGFMMGCSGKAGKLKTQPESESKVTQQKLMNNWPDYQIWFKSAVIVFDPKDDDKTILVGSYWGTVKNQETWEQIVKTIQPLKVISVRDGPLTL